MLALDVSAWAAIVTEAGQSADYGMVDDVAAIPSQLRRRMPAFARETVRCGLELARAAPESELIFSSRHGDLTSNVELLCELSAQTLLSPTRFSVSVHNAPVGLIGQCLGTSASHTAIAGDEDTFMAGLTEAYARLVTREAQSVIVIHADVELPPIYSVFDEGGAGVYLGLCVTCCSDDLAREGAIAAPGRAGLVRLVAQLNAGTRRVQFTPPQVKALAA